MCCRCANDDCRIFKDLFGLWLIAAPWILGTDNNMAMWNGVICGIILIPLSLPKGKVEDKRGSFDKYIV